MKRLVGVSTRQSGSFQYGIASPGFQSETLLLFRILRPSPERDVLDVFAVWPGSLMPVWVNVACSVRPESPDAGLPQHVLFVAISALSVNASFTSGNRGRIRRSGLNRS